MLEFSTCNAGTVTYDIPSVDRQGVIPIERIVLDNVPLCYVLNSEAAEVATSPTSSIRPHFGLFSPRTVR
jgi:hypothetical protein